MASVLDKLVAKPPAEFGGSRASNRLKYQKDWTLCLLIKLHGDGDDYLVVCDYHDDVLVLDGGSAPSRVDFYQVKSSEKKSWTIDRLIKQEVGSSGSPLPSVLGKLYRHRLEFGGDVGSLNFVSNLLSIKLEKASTTESSDKFTFVEVQKAEQAKVLVALKNELALSVDPILDASIVFHLSDLHVKGHSEQAKGRLLDFLHRKVPGRAQFPVQPLYRVIADEIERRTNYEKPCTAIVDLMSLKGIGRADFERFITDCLLEADRKSPEQLQMQLASILSAEGVPFGGHQAITRAFAKFSLERLGGSRIDLVKFSAEARKYTHRHFGAHRGRLIDFLKAGLGALKKLAGARSQPDEYLMAILAWEVLTNDGEFSTAGSESTEEDV